MTVGAQLREARKERKLSIADATRETKIQPWVLEALEAGRLQDIMSPIYVKGFLATYARFLHLESESLLAQLTWLKDPIEEEESPPVALVPFSFQVPWGLLRRLRGPLLVALGLVALFMVKPLRWLPSFNLPHRQASVSVGGEGGANVSPQILSTVPTQPLELSVTVHRSTWVRVRADGKLLTQQHLQRGAQETWTAAKQLELIVAKPSQVEVTLNGQSISSLAVMHHGRLLITHHGVRRLPSEDF